MKFFKHCQICHKLKIKTLEDNFNNSLCLSCSEKSMKYLMAVILDKNRQIDEYHKIAKELGNNVAQHNKANEELVRALNTSAESIKSLQELINFYRGSAGEKIKN